MSVDQLSCHVTSCHIRIPSSGSGSSSQSLSPSSLSLSSLSSCHHCHRCHHVVIVIVVIMSSLTSSSSYHHHYHCHHRCHHHCCRPRDLFIMSLSSSLLSITKLKYTWHMIFITIIVNTWHRTDWGNVGIMSWCPSGTMSLNNKLCSHFTLQH